MPTRRKIPRKRSYRGDMNNVTATTGLLHSPVLEAPAENKRIKLQNSLLPPPATLLNASNSIQQHIQRHFRRPYHHQHQPLLPPPPPPQRQHHLQQQQQLLYHHHPQQQPQTSAVQRQQQFHTHHHLLHFKKANPPLLLLNPTNDSSSSSIGVTLMVPMPPNSQQSQQPPTSYPISVAVTQHHHHHHQSNAPSSSTCHQSSCCSTSNSNNNNKNFVNSQSNPQSQPVQKSPKKPPKARDTGDYKITIGEVLSSDSHNYEIVEFLGRGTFGQVVRCLKRDSDDVVAVKILKNHPSYVRQGQIEVSILNTLEREQADRCNIVKALEIFKHEDHTCLAFELLKTNLYDYLKNNKFAPMPLRSIRPIAQQILVALIKLKQLGLVHADLKPENIMLVDPIRQPFRIKVIDFGSASQINRTVPGIYLQSRYYRAPEVLVGHVFSEAIDMWSLGCVLAELLLGWPLYPGSCEYDQIRYICETQGVFSAKLLTHGAKSRKFFVPTVVDSGIYTWRLKTPEEFMAESGRAYRESRKYVFSCLDDIAQANLPNSSSRAFHGDQGETADRYQFIELLKGMLTIEPKYRMQPTTAIRSAFISMAHLSEHPHYLQQCRYDMGICGGAGGCPLALPSQAQQSPLTNNNNLASINPIYGNYVTAQPQIPTIAAAAAAYNHATAAALIPFPNMQGYSQVPENIVANPLYWAATAAAAAAAAACSHFPSFIQPPLPHHQLAAPPHQQQQQLGQSAMAQPHASFEVGKFPFGHQQPFAGGQRMGLPPATHHLHHNPTLLNPNQIHHQQQQHRQSKQLLFPFAIPPPHQNSGYVHPSLMYPIAPSQQPNHPMLNNNNNGHHHNHHHQQQQLFSDDLFNSQIPTNYMAPTSSSGEHSAHVAAYAAAVAMGAAQPHNYQQFAQPGLLDYTNNNNNNHHHHHIQQQQQQHQRHMPNFNHLGQMLAPNTPQMDPSLNTPLDLRFSRKSLPFRQSIGSSPQPPSTSYHQSSSQSTSSMANVHAASVAAAYALAGNSTASSLAANEKLNTAMAAVKTNGFSWQHHPTSPAANQLPPPPQPPTKTKSVAVGISQTDLAESNAANAESDRKDAKISNSVGTQSIKMEDSSTNTDIFMISSPESTTAEPNNAGNPVGKDIKRSSSRVTVITISSGDDDDGEAAKRAEQKPIVLAEAKVRKSSVNKNEL